MRAELPESRGLRVVRDLFLDFLASALVHCTIEIGYTVC
jgi:hypothetical protein